MNEDENGSLLVRNSREEKNRERSTASNKYIHPPDEVAYK